MPEHEETVIEFNQFQKLDFPQLAVNFDCEKLSEIQLLDFQACNHATPRVCLINSIQFLTGFRQENHAKRRKTVRTDVDENLQKTPIGDIRDAVPVTDSYPK